MRIHPTMTAWHITWGTYGTRLHGDERPTVDHNHNTLGTPFLKPDPQRKQAEQQRLTADPVIFNLPQLLFIQEQIVQLCEKGGWHYRICAAQPDHVHVLLDVDPAIHGEKVRRLLKRRLGQELNKQWQRQAPSWWAEEGSNKAVKEEQYLNNVYQYILRQRA